MKTGDGTRSDQKVDGGGGCSGAKRSGDGEITFVCLRIETSFGVGLEVVLSG